MDQSRKTSEVIFVNFKTKEITKSVEIDNTTGEVVSSFEVLEIPEKPVPFMGGGFTEIINILLKKNGKGA